MSVRMHVSNMYLDSFPCNLFRPLIGPQITWSVWGLSLVNPPSPQLKWDGKLVYSGLLKEKTTTPPQFGSSLSICEIGVFSKKLRLYSTISLHQAFPSTLHLKLWLRPPVSLFLLNQGNWVNDYNYYAVLKVLKTCICKHICKMPFLLNTQNIRQAVCSGPIAKLITRLFIEQPLASPGSAKYVHSRVARQPRCLLYKSDTQHLTPSSQEPDQSRISRPYCSPSSRRGWGETPTRWGGIVSPQRTRPQMAELGSLQRPGFFLDGSDSRLKTRPSRHPQNWRERTYTTDVCFMVNCV